MNKIVRAGIVLLAGASAVASHRAEAQATLSGAGAEFIAVGVSRLSMGDLDDRLEAQGYPTFGRASRSAMLGVYRIVSGGWTLGGEFNGVMPGTERHDGRTVGLGGGYATIGVGRMFELSPRARVYPRLGVGPGGFGLWVERREGEPVAFDDALADPDRYSSSQFERDQQLILNRSGLMVDYGLGAELLSRARGRGPVIGVRLGLLTTPINSDWEMPDRDVRDGPPASIAGPYIRILVGTGRNR